MGFYWEELFIKIAAFGPRGCLLIREKEETEEIGEAAAEAEEMEKEPEEAGEMWNGMVESEEMGKGR